MKSDLKYELKKMKERNQTDPLNMIEEIRRLCSHDMKSPIGAILESCAMLKEDSDLNSFQNDLAQNIEDAVYSLYDMIDRIHEITKLNESFLSFSGSHVNLMSCVKSVVSRLAYLIQQHGIEVIIQSPVCHLIKKSQNIMIQVDDVVISAILKHLVKTVVLASSKGESIKIELTYGKSAFFKISFSAQLPKEINDILIGSISPGMDHWKRYKQYYDLMIVREFIKMTDAVIDIFTESDYETSLILQIPILCQNNTGESHEYYS